MFLKIGDTGSIPLGPLLLKKRGRSAQPGCGSKNTKNIGTLVHVWFVFFRGYPLFGGFKGKPKRSTTKTETPNGKIPAGSGDESVPRHILYQDGANGLGGARPMGASGRRFLFLFFTSKLPDRFLFDSQMVISVIPKSWLLLSPQQKVNHFL